MHKNILISLCSYFFCVNLICHRTRGQTPHCAGRPLRGYAAELRTELMRKEKEREGEAKIAGWSVEGRGVEERREGRKEISLLSDTEEWL